MWVGLGKPCALQVTKDPRSTQSLDGSEEGGERGEGGYLAGTSTELQGF